MGAKQKYSNQPGKFNKEKLKNIVKGFLSNPIYLIGVIAIIFLTYTIVVPLWQMLSNTLFWGDGDQLINPDAVPGNFTLEHWKSMLTGEASRNIFYKPIIRSLGIGVAVSFMAMVMGVALAWLVTRSDIPYKKTLTFLAVIPYMIPSWMKSMAWIVVFKNDRIGGAPGLFQYVLGVSPPDWISYGFLPIVIVLGGMHYYVYFFLLTAAALNSINSSMEETADILGAKRFTILRRVTFPPILPSILSGIILVFSKAIGTFEPAGLLGLLVKYYVISTMLYSSMKTGMATEGYVLSLTLIALAALVIYINQKAIGKRRGYDTVGGKDGRKTEMPLGRWRMPIFISVVIFMLASAILPLALLTLQSFMLKDGVYSLSNFTTHFWVGKADPNIAMGTVGVLVNDAIGLALRNSLTISLVGASVAALIGITFGYVIAKGRRSVTGKVVEQLAFAPYLIPGIALSAIYLTMFAKPGIIIPSLYGTLTLIILITIVKDLPFATRSGISNMFQISGELEEAAQIQGASFFRRFFKIMFPLTRQGLLSAFLIGFISAMKQLDLVLLLVTPRTGTLPTLTFEYAETGYPQFANAIMLIIIAITMVTYYVAVKWGKADLSKGIGG